MNMNMNKNVLFAFCVAGTCLHLSGCGDDANAESLLPVENVERLYSDTYLDNGQNTPKKSMVISSGERYASEVGKYTNDNVISVDFSRYKVLLIDMGIRPTGGYAIDLKSTTIQLSNKPVTLDIVYNVPGENCVMTEAITNPYAFYKVPTQGDVLIRETLEIVDC